MNRNTFKYWYVGFIFLVTTVCLAYYFFSKKTLYENGQITNAHVYAINQGSVKSGKVVIKYYFYNTRREKYYGGEDAGLSYNVKNELLNLNFPVVYDTLNPNNSELLIDIKSWRKLNLTFPDSLDWLRKYYP
jgi:hypothetical protein